MAALSLSPEDRVFLEAARVGRLATASAGGEPHVVPVCFVFDGTRLYSAIDRKPKRVAPSRLRRLRNLQENPRASLIVDHYEEDWGRLRYVIVRGRAAILEDGPERDRALALLREKYPQYRTMPGFDKSPVIRLTPEQVASWAAVPPDPSA
jgi:coenzyme F420-0:L-glutamate ligase/coenzyme F420-1:gamma-L-glutamate ligase